MLAALWESSISENDSLTGKDDTLLDKVSKELSHEKVPEDHPKMSALFYQRTSALPISSYNLLVDCGGSHCRHFCEHPLAGILPQMQSPLSGAGKWQKYLLGPFCLHFWSGGKPLGSVGLTPGVGRRAQKTQGPPGNTRHRSRKSRAHTTRPWPAQPEHHSPGQRFLESYDTWARCQRASRSLWGRT